MPRSARWLRNYHACMAAASPPPSWMRASWPPHTPPRNNPPNLHGAAGRHRWRWPPRCVWRWVSRGASNSRHRHPQHPHPWHNAQRPPPQRPRAQRCAPPTVHATQHPPPPLARNRPRLSMRRLRWTQHRHPRNACWHRHRRKPRRWSCSRPAHLRKTLHPLPPPRLPSPYQQLPPLQGLRPQQPRPSQRNR